MHNPLSSATVGYEYEINFDANLAFVSAFSLNDLPSSKGSFFVILPNDNVSKL